MHHLSHLSSSPRCLSYPSPVFSFWVCNFLLFFVMGCRFIMIFGFGGFNLTWVLCVCACVFYFGINYLFGFMLDIYWKNEHRLRCSGETCTAAERDRYEKSVICFPFLLYFTVLLILLGVFNRNDRSDCQYK